MRRAPGLAPRSGSPTDRRRSKGSISIRPKRPTRRSLCTSTVVRGVAAKPRTTASRPNFSFMAVGAANGDIGVMAEQVRRAIAWTYKNAASFSGDTNRFYIGGHSSGGHLCGVALVTDWQKDFGLPADMVKGGLCMSGMYDMKPVRLSKRSSYVKFTDDMEQAMSSLRQLDQLRAPIIVTYGTNETPEFQRQSRDFAAAVKAAGKPIELIEGPNFNHLEMCESLGNPYGPNGRAR